MWGHSGDVPERNLICEISFKKIFDIRISVSWSSLRKIFYDDTGIAD